ncbi:MULTISPECIES: polysaccharide deacetylase [Streptomyces]|uniref:polysaccharide deacetylase family protein n=1 Tax=Streptomyces TaxID=1883 RepID=UPI002DDB4B53|nr:MULTISPECIES: polysaccharide deacetylase [unclassified Streptomyces]WSD94621.1 polysaccharide deacetylase [Streptomyces sp. NBC_01474]
MKDIRGRWPNGARAAVMISVDHDADLAILSGSPATADRGKTLSVGRYGTDRGIDRLLGLFAELAVPATWFVPGRNAERHPEAVRRIAAAGHELACHGDNHEDFQDLTLDEQTRAARDGADRLRQATGSNVRGFRTPAGEWKPGLGSRLAGFGIDWSSSSPGDDLPYLHPGTHGVVEIPVQYELEDHQYFFFNLEPPFPTGQSRIASYAHVLGNWTQEFTAYHRFGLCYVLRLHPEVTGTPGRIGLVRELITHIQGHPDVWLATGSQIADRWRAQHPANDPGHPADLFARLTADREGTA